MFFFFNDTATTEIYTLSLHDALPIFPDDTKTDNQNQQFAFRGGLGGFGRGGFGGPFGGGNNAQTATSSDRMKKKRSEEHTSELQSPCNLVCRLLLEKKKTHCESTPRD